MSLIIPGGPGDPHRQAASSPYSGESAHGLSSSQIEAINARFEQFLPQLVSTDPELQRSRLLEEDFRKNGASASPFRKLGQVVPGGTNFGAGTSITPQTPYAPEFASPDRQSYPVHRILANRYWRLFHKLDPVIGSCIDLFAEMPWSDFQLTGEGVDGEVRDHFESMCEETEFLALLPYLTREFFVVGEAIPHAFYNGDKHRWDYVTVHNPDQIEVVDAPFIRMDPIIEMIPDQRLRAILSSGDPLLQKVREQMPPELLGRLLSRQNIPLDNLNCTLLARKLHPYDVRGTSIISRLWRVMMLEDAVANVSLATARRHCFVAGTQVMTPDGVKPIEDLKQGDRVISGNGVAQTVEDAWEEPPSDDGLVEITALGSEKIFCTPGHKFPVWASARSCACGCGQPVQYNGRGYRNAFVNGHDTKCGHARDPKTGRMTADAGIDWKVYSSDPKVRAPSSWEPARELRADEILRGDYLVIPRGFDEIRTEIRPEQARLLGYYVAEGGNYVLGGKSRPDNSVSMTFSLSEYDTWVQDAVSCGKQIGLNLHGRRDPSKPGTKCFESGREGKSTVSVTRVDDLWFAEWCKRHGGVGANNKCLSEEVMRWPLYLKEELIRGYYRGDGHFGMIKSTQQVTALTTSRVLAYQVRLILAQLGVLGSISFSPSDNDEWSDRWILSSTGRDARVLAKLIWGLDVEPIDHGDTRKGGGSKAWSDENYIYVLVRKTRRVGDCVPTYNLTVSGDHTYTVQGGLTTANSSPIKIAKIGNPQTGWIPGPEHERRLLELLAQAELDPHSFICFVEGTPVTLVDGTTRPIEQMKAGDEVIDQNGVTQVVEAAWCEGTPSEVTEIEVAGRMIRATHNHKWPVVRSVPGGSATRIVCKRDILATIELTSAQIKTGDFLISPRDQGMAELFRVGHVALVTNDKPVYNLTVSGSHTYLVYHLATANCYHFGVQFEAFGTTDRAMWIGREWEALERMKLVGLGVSKSFVSGEITYASAVAGLQVFLQRLLTMRNWFESKWIYKKFFRPVSEINDFVKPTKAELSHRVRIRRTAQEIENDRRFIVPVCAWDKPLDPNVDRDLISAADSLTRIGVKFSKKTLMSFVNRKFEDELKASLEEETFEASERQKYQKALGPAGQGPTGIQPSGTTVEQYEQTQGGQPVAPAPGQPGGPPATQPPPRPGTVPSVAPGGQPGPVAPMPQQATGEAPVRRNPMLDRPPKLDWRQDQHRLGNWDVGEVEGALELFRTGRSDDPFWTQAAGKTFKDALFADPAAAWQDLQIYLESQGYPDPDIQTLEAILIEEDILPKSDVEQMFDAMPDEIAADGDAEAAFLRAFRRQKSDNGSSRLSTSSLLGDGNGGGGTARSPFRRSRS